MGKCAGIAVPAPWCQTGTIHTTGFALFVLAATKNTPLEVFPYQKGKYWTGSQGNDGLVFQVGVSSCCNSSIQTSTTNLFPETGTPGIPKDRGKGRKSSVYAGH